MINGFPLSSLAHYHQVSCENPSLRQATLRRKSAHLWDSAQGAVSGYPSPPMSSPPSPTRRPSDFTLPSTRSEQFLAGPTNPILTSSTAEYSSHQITAPIATSGLTKPDVPAYHHPPASFATGPGIAPLGPGSVAGAYATTSYAPPPITHQRTASQDARKSKTHVASACVNCKRAHLSCDVQRPCARCVSSGKQVSVASYSSVDDLLTHLRTPAMMLLTRKEDDLDCVMKVSSATSGRCPLQMLP